MTSENILKNAYLSGHADYQLIFDDRPECNSNLDKLEADGLIIVKTRAIGYAVISLTPLGVQYCEKFS